MRTKNPQKFTDWNCFFASPLFAFGVFQGYQKFLPILEERWPKKGAKILELGSGSGRLSLWLSKYLPVSEIVLVDANEKMLAKSRKIFSKTKIPARFIKKDIRCLDLKESFDLVHSAGVLEHFSYEEQNVIIGAYRRHLKHEGFAIAYAPTLLKTYWFWRHLQEVVRTWRFFDETPISKDELIGLFRDNHFEIIGTNYVWRFYLSEVGVLARLLY